MTESEALFGVSFDGSCHEERVVIPGGASTRVRLYADVDAVFYCSPIHYIKCQTLPDLADSWSQNLHSGVPCAENLDERKKHFHTRSQSQRPGKLILCARLLR
jgi:hypothetical protein